MKNYFFLFLALLFLISCEKESTTDLLDEQNIDKNGTANLRGPAPKIDVCHYDSESNSWKVINISENAWPDHAAHGDVQLVDTDGDGWVTAENECGFPVDCDDTDAELTDNCSTACVEGELEVILPDGTTLFVNPNVRSYQWGDTGIDINGLTNVNSEADALNDFNGASNTAAIVAELGNWNDGNYGANYCATLSAVTGCEWYLPAAGELNEIYKQLGAKGSGEIRAIAWSSTEQSSFSAWLQFLSSNDTYVETDPKDDTWGCYCVRK